MSVCVELILRLNKKLALKVQTKQTYTVKYQTQQKTGYYKKKVTDQKPSLEEQDTFSLSPYLTNIPFEPSTSWLIDGGRKSCFNSGPRSDV